MKPMTKEERREAIEHNRKLYTYSNDKSINGGVLVEKLPNADEQIISFDKEDEDWNEFKIR
ncbi:hypothetical protein HTVC103P_gp06 [Pelagibacter phage HTVC103P]|nr:hypothetical protein HTVC103P_gp06 [Pelagibacter phage HTVC103P]